MIFFKNIKSYKNVIHGILERKEGSFNPSSNPKSEKNILKALNSLGYKNAGKDNLIFADQVHGKNIWDCPPGIGGYIKHQTDGLITKNPGQILVIKTADCIPLLIYDPKTRKIGAIHAGRKGIIKGVVEEAVAAFQSNPSLFVVGIGPHIRACCYYLKERDKDLALKGEFREYFQEKKGKLYFDLTHLAIDKLIKAGIKEKNIEDSNICTFCHAERFYSARKRKEQPDIYKKEKERFPCFGSFIGLRSKD